MEDKDFLVVKKHGLNYSTDKKGKIIKYKSWMNGLFAPLYDLVMKKSVFPKKLNASYEKHFRILKGFFQDIRHKSVLEIATGSGSLATVLSSDNRYYGVDISEGLLRQALKRLKKHGFYAAELYLSDACSLPFPNETFDVIICNLSLNFIGRIDFFINELKRVSKPDSVFFCSVPVPEKMNKKVRIRGVLYPEKELKEKFEKQHFLFRKLTEENGAVLYFTASLRS